LTCVFGGKNAKNNFLGRQWQWNQSPSAALGASGYAPAPSIRSGAERERLAARQGRRAEARLYLNGKCNDKATAEANATATTTAKEEAGPPPSAKDDN